MNPINKIIIESGCRIAREIEAKALLIYTDFVANAQFSEDNEICFDVVLVAKGDEAIPENLKHLGTILKVPNIDLTRVAQIKVAIIKGIAMGLFKKGDKIVCLAGVHKLGYVDSISVIDVGREFEFLTSANIGNITDKVYPEVFGEVMNIALELSAQGREGRKVGTIFVLGDHEKVMQLSRQMIINPFLGYAEEERNILNAELKETIKEFSALDGAFIIKDNGAIETAGSHLNAALESKDFPQGLGSRHIAAAGMTSITNAIAIVLSESSGSVSVFENGKIFVRIEKSII
jgi:diadenylate cyclase